MDRDTDLFLFKQGAASNVSLQSPLPSSTAATSPA
jgi:hypothetical protein